VRTRILIAAAAVFGLVAAPASADIVVNRSIAGVELGMSRRQVIALLGDPDRSVTNPALETTYTYKSRGLRVTFYRQGSTNDVTTIDLRKRGERTASRVGVGSTYRAVRAGISGERCVRAPNRKHRWCTALAGGRQTTFVISSTGHVREIVFSFRGD